MNVQRFVYPLVFGLLCGCGEDAADDAITVGALVPLTGRLEFLAQILSGGIDVARNEINARGGVLDQPLRVELGDEASGGDEAVVTAEVDRFAASGIQASLVSSSGGAGFAIDAAADKPMLLLSGSAVNPDLSAEPNDLFFRTVAPVVDLSDASAAYIASEGITTLAMIYVSPDSVYDNQLPRQIARLEELGVTISIDQSYMYEAGSFDPAPILAQVYSEQPDAIYFGGYAADGTELLQSLDRGQYNGRLFAGSGFQQQEIANNAGAPKVEGLEVITSFAPAGPAFDRFKTAFEDANSINLESFTIIAAGMYDATAVLGLAMHAAGTTDALAVRDQLRNVGSPPGTPIEAGQLAEGFRLLDMGMPINYEGMASSADFDENGDVEESYGLWRFTSGQLTYVRTLIAGVDY